ncbi:antitermination regulator [Prescottella equi]|nr:GAF and ANTAR domain-containing protein [Prescottella equi]ORL29569.1 antitermination regulator [Prescottella equi]
MAHDGGDEGGSAATTPRNVERHVRVAIEAMARDMRDEHASLDGTLEVITRAAVELVPGAEHADITLAVRGGRLESRAGTSELPSRIDDLQQLVDDGPCLQAIWEHETVRVDDMAHEDRWPRFAPRAADAGIGSMLAFQLYTTESNLGALNLLSASPHAFDSTSVSVGGSLATHAAIAVIAAQREEQFGEALQSRDTIGQAKGMLMERFSVDADHAFGLLRKLSQERNVPIYDIARKLTEGDERPAV